MCGTGRGSAAAALNQFDDQLLRPAHGSQTRPPITGGYTQDPKTGGGFDQNFSKIEGSSFVQPKRLPKDLQAQVLRQGRFDPNTGVSDEGSFSMPLGETVVYTKALDGQGFRSGR